jgi:protoporphyrinogen oxidase
MAITDRKSIVILGAGITGLTAAWFLSQSHRGNLIVLEKEATVGGLAATFNRNGFSFDLGSHRLHEGYHPEVDALVKDLCGDDLLRRERRGQIYLGGKVLLYPPSPFDIVFAFGLADSLRFIGDFLLARLGRLVSSREHEDFEGFTISMVGKSLYERFYRPYALKLYGMSPRDISKDPAVNRVRKFSFRSFYSDFRKKLHKEVPTYLYPSGGIGQLSRALEQRFLENGGQIHFISSIDHLKLKEDRSVEAVAFTNRDGSPGAVETDAVVSTIPLDALHRLVRLDSDRNGPPPFELRWRGLRLLYVITRDKTVCDHETFYFPEPEIIFGRVSELNKYSAALNTDTEEAVLTLEIPCSYDDTIWNMPDDQLTDLCLAELRRMCILREQSTGRTESFSRKLKQVYPVYESGWRDGFERILGRLDAIENLYPIGRAALFLHCNIDQCMLMALKVAQHLSKGCARKGEWLATRQEFFNYRVRE